jgi:hypothetical protein
LSRWPLLKKNQLDKSLLEASLGFQIMSSFIFLSTHAVHSMRVHFFRLHSNNLTLLDRHAIHIMAEIDSLQFPRSIEGLLAFINLITRVSCWRSLKSFGNSWTWMLLLLSVILKFLLIPVYLSKDKDSGLLFEACVAVSLLLFNNTYLFHLVAFNHFILLFS